MRSQPATRNCSAARAPSSASEMKPTSMTSQLQFRHALRYSRRRLLQLRKQVRKLRPVGAEATCDEADPRSASGDPLKTRGVIDVALRCRHRSLLTRDLALLDGDQRRKAAATPASTGMCNPVVWERSPPVRAKTAAATCSGSTSRLRIVRWA